MSQTRNAFEESFETQSVEDIQKMEEASEEVSQVGILEFQILILGIWYTTRWFEKYWSRYH